VQVLRGRVRMHSNGDCWDRPGDLLFVPQAAHDVEAVEDAVFLLTVTKPGRRRAPVEQT
jgi:quercetin dioxygenase-like cupin family protein